MKLTGAHVAAARELLRLSQGELAKIAGIGRATLARFESGAMEPHPSNLEKIQLELERRGIQFSNGEGIGVRLNFAKAAEFARSGTHADK
jgi:transcriptional regulator with XRE-family HTH domain